MIKKGTFKKIIVFGVSASLILASLVGCTQKVTQEDVDYAKQAGYSEGVASVDITSDNALVAATAASTATSGMYSQAQLDAKVKEQEDKDNKILEDYKEEQTKIEEEEVTELKLQESGYVLDGQAIGAVIGFTVSDRQLNKLYDEDVRFDGDEFSVEEVITLMGLKVANNYEDEYKANAYLQIPEGGITYEVVFASDLDTSLIGAEGYEDETLVFNFLGEQVEVSKWLEGKVTFTKGTEIDLKEGFSEEVEGKVITLSVAGDDYVSVDVDGVSKKISEGKTEKVNGIEIRAFDIIESTSWRTGIATLEIGEDVLFEVEDGEEYEADERFEWVIDSNSIGITLTEEFKSIDEDEEYKALALGEQLFLPNDYLSITYDGLVEEDTEKYTFELKGEFVEARGDFVFETDSYNRVYIYSDGIYDDKDKEDAELNETSVKLADTELTLDVNSTSLKIDDIVLNLNLAGIKVNGKDLSTEDEDYLTTYGIVIDNPKDSVEDEEFKITVPEEELTASLTIR